jgi:eukaryotic-like serine/threonine-protein kinase
MIDEQVSHYQLLEHLGEGGMGVVYKAQDLRLGRTVALKFLPPETSRDAIAKERFIREARAASALDHPNICTIYEVDETADGRLFLAMAHYTGENLRQRLAARGALPVADAIAIALQVARGLAAAHAAGIVHRDIKPANVMLPPGAEAKILDFGLAKIGQDPRQLTRTGSTMGTLAYMSPEQAQTGAADARSDLWALGVILYEMLGGQAPFTAAGEAAVLYRIVHEEPKPLADRRGDLPGVVEVVAALLQKDPQERLQSAAELVTALDSLARGSALAATAVVGTASLRSRQLLPSRRRRRWRWSAAAVLAVALASGAWYALSRPPQSTSTNLAVLPFRNLTGDASRDYFAEGLSSVLTQQLAAISGLNVVGRSETASYREGERPARDIARELGVSALVTGEVVRLDGERLRAQANLLSPESGQIRWSAPAEGTPEEIMRWQARIAEEIADELRLALTSAERKRLGRRPTDSPEAYDLYLRAVRLFDDWEKPQTPDMQIALLERALELDRRFALAQAALSRALLLAYDSDRDAAHLQRAITAADAALAVDSGEPDARLARAAALRRTGRGAEAIGELLQLVAMHPQHDAAYVELADAYKELGEPAKREASLRQSIAIRPEYWSHWLRLGGTLLDAGSYDQAREAYEKAHELAPAMLAPRQNLAVLEIVSGNYEAAIRRYEELPNPGSDAATQTNLGTAYFYTGDLVKAERAFATAIRLEPKAAMHHANLADVLSRSGRAADAKAEYSAAAALAEQELLLNPSSERRQLRHAFYLAKAGECARAGVVASAVAARMQASASSAHTLAQVHACCGRRHEALRAVHEALRLGYSAKVLRDEDEFSTLREDAEFLQLLEAAARQ